MKRGFLIIALKLFWTVLAFLGPAFLLSSCDCDGDIPGDCDTLGGPPSCTVPVPGPGTYGVSYQDSSSTVNDVTLSTAGSPLRIADCLEGTAILTPLSRQCYVTPSQLGCYQVFFNDPSGTPSQHEVCTNAQGQLVVDDCEEVTNTSLIPPTCASAAGLVGWWPLNGTNLSGVVPDLASGNHGTIQGGGGGFLPAEVNSGFKSGGQGSLVLVPQAPSLRLSAFTIAAWIRLDFIPTFSPRVVVWKGDNIGGNWPSTPYSLMVTGDQIEATIGNGITHQSFAAASRLPTGFNHVAVTADGSIVKFYLNGQLDSVHGQTVTPYDSPFALQIGSGSGPAPGYFDGVIDELQLFGAALSAGQIQSLAYSFSAGMCPVVASGKIAFERFNEIYVMNPESGPTNLTGNPSVDVSPTWSPDGMRIAFASNRNGDSGIYEMLADGSDVRKILNTGGLADVVNLKWSPNGSKLAFTQRNIEGILWVSADGSSGVQQLTSYGTEPTWSPDSLSIAFSALPVGPPGSTNYDIYVIDAGGGSIVTRLTSDPAHDREPAWSPDGTKIAFSREHDLSTLGGIFVMNADGTNLVRLTHQVDWRPAWSPDGTKIVFARRAVFDYSSSDIFVMDANGSHQVNITNTFGWGTISNLNPAWGR